MYRILKIGMDVHTANYTLCAMEDKFGGEGQVIAQVTVAPDYKLILNFIRRIKEKMDPKGKDEIDVECGYEAGCLGYSLYHLLTACKVKCKILAPATMLAEKGPRIKTDKILPNLSLLPDAEEYPLGKYCRMRQQYLKEHRRSLYSSLMLEGRLMKHLAEIDRSCNNRLEIIYMFPDFRLCLKLNGKTGKVEMGADIRNVFDIAWYTFARMVADIAPPQDTDPNYMYPQGSILTCMACGVYFVRHSSRQRYCDNPNCQAERNNRKARAYYKRKKAEEA